MNAKCSKLSIQTTQNPGVVTFDNYEEVRAKLQSYVKTFECVDYDMDGVDVAK